jgi:hypothetical protein
MRWLLAACLAVCSASTASGIVVVLKQGAAFTAGGVLDPVFSGVTATDVAAQDVDDTYLIGNLAAAWTNYGAYANRTGDLLFKFDLSALAGMTIEKAQLRLHATAGNSGGTIARVTTWDWDETLATRASPNGLASPNRNWGPAGNDYFTAADYGNVTPVAFNSIQSNWLVKDVTADLQAFASGALPNYGWLVNSGNRPINMSEISPDGDGPALFISYTPEPATLVLLVLGGLAWVRRSR